MFFITNIHTAKWIYRLCVYGHTAYIKVWTYMYTSAHILTVWFSDQGLIRKKYSFRILENPIIMFCDVRPAQAGCKDEL